MTRWPLTRVYPAVKNFLGTSRVVVPLVAYTAFATIVYVMQGAEPILSIDHVSYFKLADEMRSEFPLGDYWRSFNSVRAYGVILAYAFELTGSHVISLKVLLAAMTIAYLWAFQLFISLATKSRAQAILFSLFSALFVSFGASIWGVTDFAASLNRTLVVPFVVLLVWFFFREFHSPWRYAVYPALIFLSLLHLSALHVFFVFGAFELIDFIVRRRCKIDRNLFYFALSLLSSVVIQSVIEYSGSGNVGYVRHVLAMTTPSVAEISSLPSKLPEVAKSPAKLTYKEAWRIELVAFPWRNFPPPLATLATVASSFGVIFLLAVMGAMRAFRSGVPKPLDREMVNFALAVLVAAYGLQTLLWALRNTVPVFPINFEEIRAINMIMIPSVYFIFRLYELAPELWGMSREWIRAAIMLAFALQPIILVRAMPTLWRENLLDQMVARSVVKSNDSLRMLYARQFLGLADNGCRFYYSSRPTIEWLERNANSNDLVLTNLNEFHMSRVKSIGPFLEVVALQVWDVHRAKWAELIDKLDRALATRDLGRVMTLARSLGATYAVVNWTVNDAAYHDDCYSVVRVQ